MATYSTPIPGVAQYGQAALAAKTAYQNALARINQQRQSLLRQKGFLGDIDPTTGVAKNVRTDPGNQYGEFQLLNRSQAGRDQAAVESGVARGLGTGGGLAAQLRNRERFSFGQEDAALGESLVSGLAGLQDQQTQAAFERDSALREAELEAARMAIQNQDFNQADFSGLDYADYGQNPSAPAPAPSTKTRAVAKMKPTATKYYTFYKDVIGKLKPGQTIHFTPGKGYYAA